MFRAGADALAHLLGTPSAVYRCPICGNGFAEESVLKGMLTLEHVPPAALGGKGLVLTCRECNNTAGHDVDACAVASDSIDRFQDALKGGDAEFSGHAKVEVGGHVIRAQVDVRKKTVTIVPLTDQTNPAHLASANKYFDDLMAGLIDEPPKYRITPIQRFRERSVRVSALRTAYLAAFAAFGYRYAFDERLLKVRSQIQSPRDEVVKHHWIRPAVRLRDPVLMIASDPIVCLAVGFRSHLVVLPWNGNSGDLEASLSAIGERITLNGQRIAWPERATYQLDRAGYRALHLSTR